MYLFWDNSNIHYSGLNTVYPMLEPGKERGIYRTYFKNLFELVRNGRVINGAYAAGSVGNKAGYRFFWQYFRLIIF